LNNVPIVFCDQQAKYTAKQPVIRLVMKKALAVQCVRLRFGRDKLVIATCAMIAPYVKQERRAISISYVPVDAPIADGQSGRVEKGA
jgi:hypothetical protein